MSKWQHTNGGIITAAPGSFRETLCKGSPDWTSIDDRQAEGIHIPPGTPADVAAAEENRQRADLAADLPAAGTEPAPAKRAARRRSSTRTKS